MSENMAHPSIVKQEVINNIKKEFDSLNKQTILGIGDDSAIIKYDNQAVIATNMLLEGIHFDLTYTPIKHLGYKSVIAAISNIYAMNAKPKQILISLSVARRFTKEMIEIFYQGVKLACNRYNVDLIGGDLKSSKTGVAISATAIGEPMGEIIKRSGAKANDLICVTGDLGSAYMGLQLLEREKTVFENNPNKQPEFKNAEYILERQLKPEINCEVLDYLKSKEITPTSMTDLSQGLANQIISICDESQMGCEIFEDRIPINEQTKEMAKEFNINPLVCALNGGEDYELLFTINLKDYNKVKDNDFFSIIGSINDKDKGRNIVLFDGSIVSF